MMPRNPLNALRLALLLLVLFWLCPLVAHVVPGPQQEQQSQSQEQKPPENAQPASPAPSSTDAAPKKRKIWTNDDVIELRAPADVYLAEKELRDAAQAEAAKRSKDTKPEKPDAQDPLPATAEETQVQITSKERQAAYEQNRLDDMRAALADTPADQQLAKLKGIDALASNLEKIQTRLKLLLNHLKRLQSPPPEKPVAEKSPAELPPPSF